jgi:fatty-acyl-CoA synthase
MPGYWNDEAATKRAIDAAGWMHSGDMAVMDEQGYVNIVGRIKDLIIRGGENISPREIEEVLHTHPGVNDVQIVGVPSKKYGEEVMAWVRLHAGVSTTGEELRAYCQARMAGFKVPHYWQFTVH